jgi:hypothetical protein
VMLGEGLGLQALHLSLAKGGHMDTLDVPILVHVPLIDARVVGIFVMGWWRPLDIIVSWRKSIS